jgi:hypothetical protein
MTLVHHGKCDMNAAHLHHRSKQDGVQEGSRLQHEIPVRLGHIPDEIWEEYVAYQNPGCVEKDVQ